MADYLTTGLHGAIFGESPEVKCYGVGSTEAESHHEHGGYMERPNPENFMTKQARERWRVALAAHYLELDRELDRVRNNPARPRRRPGASIEVGIPLAAGGGKLS